MRRIVHCRHRLPIGLVALFVSIIVTSPCMLWASDYKSFVAEGDAYYKKFNNTAALEAYKKAYKLSPDDLDVLTKLTRAYNDVGEDLNSKESEEYYLKAVEHAELLKSKSPDREKGYFYYAVSSGNLALFRGGKEKVKLSRGVEQNIKKAIEINPNYGSAHIVLGVYYREVANLNFLLKAFAKAFFGGLPNGTNEDSEKALLRAIALIPNSVRAHFELGLTYKEMDKKDKAIRYLKRTIQLPVTDHQDNQTKALADKELKDVED